MIGGVAGGHHRQQHLRRADVGRGLLAPDVLLAGLEGEAHRRTAGGVDRDAHQAPGQRAAQLVRHRHEPGVRAAGAHRHTEALGGSDRNVGAPLAWWGQQGARQQVGGDRHQGPRLVQGSGQRAEVADRAVGGRVGEQRSEVVGGFDATAARIDQVQLDAQGRRPRGDHGDHLRVAANVDEKLGGLALRLATAQGERLGGRGGLVEQRRTGEVQAGQVLHHGLEVEQRLQAALGDLGLVRGVGGVPGGVLQHVALDHGRGMGAVVALPDHRRDHPVATRQLTQVIEQLVLGHRPGQIGQPKRLVVAHRRGHGGIDQLVHRLEAQSGEHGDGLV